MTQLLQEAFVAVQQLPPEKQDSIASLILSLTEGKRPLGLARGLGTVPEDFNEPLPDDELALWYEIQAGDPLK